MTAQGQDTRPRGFDSYEIRLGDELRGERATAGKSLLDVQRDLRIRASYIAAIENCDHAVFPNPGFVPGYVRSYARYLRLDADDVLRRFYEESGWQGATPAAGEPRAPGTRSGPARPLRPAQGDDPLLRSIRTPAADLRPGLAERLPFSALASVMVLALLLAGLGYGGYTVLQNIQRVTIAPVDQRPETLAALTDMSAPAPGDAAESPDARLPAPRAVTDTDLSRLYEPRELEVPVVASRDGPIVEIDPSRAGILAPPPAPAAEIATAAAPAEAAATEPQVREPARVPEVRLVARQPAWVRVYLESGTVLFEKILEAGETWQIPADADAPLLRAGNAGAVYVLLDGAAYGPIGQGASVAKQIPLQPAAVQERFARVEAMPEVLQASVSALDLPAAAE